MSPVKAREEVLEELRQAFKGVQGSLRRLRGRETQRAGELSFAQYSLLFGLADGEMSAGALATAADLSPATVTQMLDGLERAGLVARARSERDKRVVLVSLTERGRALHQERSERFERVWSAALDDFSERDLATAGAVLERLRGVFDELAERD
jgi:DNA-binding MarR family transcriptional regulator